jgi:hypothetical protein
MPGFENEELTGFLSENEDKAQKRLDAFLKRDFRDLKVKTVLVRAAPLGRSSAMLIQKDSI